MKARRVKKLDPAAPLAENAARIVKVRLGELCSFAPLAIGKRKVKAQHDMRIAAKRLRYVLEVTELCFGRPGEVARRRARDLQDVLGELHDCDVMLPRLRDHLAELRERDAAAIRARAGDAPDLDPRLVARAPHRTAYRGLDSLAVYVEARREVLFDRFRELWEQQEKKGTWDRLERAADRRLAWARERRRAKRNRPTSNLWRLPGVPEFARGSRLLEDAYELAADAHCGSGRHGDTGIDHPTAVAALLDEQGFDREVVAAGLLHDVVEDTDTAQEEIVERFGPEVGGLVAVMTEDASIEPYEERKAEHRARVVANPRAAAVYAADKVAKTRMVMNGGGELSDAQLDHYRRTLAALGEAQPEPPFLPELEQNLHAIDAGRQHATRR